MPGLWLSHRRRWIAMKLNEHNPKRFFNGKYDTFEQNSDAIHSLPQTKAKKNSKTVTKFYHIQI